MPPKKANEEDRSDRRLLFGLPLLPLLLATAAAVLILTAAFSWYAQIRSAISGDTMVSETYWLFELGAVKNAAGTAREIPVDTVPLDIMTGLAARDYGRDNIETSPSTTGVVCAFLPDDGDALRPGATGVLQFLILPKSDDGLYYATFDLLGIKKVVDPSTMTITYEPMDSTDPDDALALDYLAGHFLFFTDRAHTHMVEPGEELLIEDADTAGEQYVINLYWEWPRTYSAHAAYVDAAWCSTHSYLDSGTGDTGYNNADQIIGERISYVVTDWTVTGSQPDPSVTPQVLEATLVDDD